MAPSVPETLSALPVRKLSIIVPVFNEAPTIADVLERVRNAPIPVDREVIVVDDGSTDDTRAIIDLWLRDLPPTAPAFEVRTYYQPNAGKGAALRLGISKATGDLVLFQDADLEMDPIAEYPGILAPILAGRASVVFGVRDTWRAAGSRLTSRLANWFLNRLTNLLYGGHGTDMETAYKCMPLAVLRGLDLRSNGFEIEPEITAKLLRAGHRIHEVAVAYRPRTTFQGKKIGWADGFKAIRTLLSHRLPDPSGGTPVPDPVTRYSFARLAEGLAALLLVLFVALFSMARYPSLSLSDPGPGQLSVDRERYDEIDDDELPPADEIVDRYRLRPDGRVHLTRRVVPGASSTPTTTCFTYLPPLDLHALVVTDGAGTRVPHEVAYVRGRQLRVKIGPRPPIRPGVPRELKLEATVPTGLTRRSGDDLCFEVDAISERDRVRHVVVEVELPRELPSAAVTSTGWSWHRIERVPGGTERLVWELRLEPAATRSLYHVALRFPAAALPSAAAPVRRTIAIHAAVSILAAILLLATGAVLVRARIPGLEPGLVILLVCIAGGSLVFLQPRLLEDNFSYQGYARTILCGLDLDLFDETYLYNSNLSFTPDLDEPIGPSGTAVLLAAPYVAAESVVRLARWSGVPLAGNGFSRPYVVAVAIWSVLLGGFTATLIYGLMRLLFDQAVSAISTLAVFFGTNLMMMVYMWTASTHIGSLALVTAFLALWHTTRGERTRSAWALLGLAAGLAIQVRPQNVALLCVPLLELTWSCLAPPGSRLRPGLTALVLFVALTAVGFSGQSVVWRAQKGQAVVDIYGVGKGRFTNPLGRLHDMFVARPARTPDPTGLLTAQPVLVPALVGLVFFAVYAPRWGLELAFFLGSQVAIVASYEVWWGRVWFATPYLIGCSLVFCLGLGAAIQVLRARFSLVTLAALLALMVAWNVRGVILQQAHEQTELDLPSASFVEGLEALLEPPAPLVTEHFKRRSSDFAFLAKGLADALETLSPGPAVIPAITLFAVLVTLLAMGRWIAVRLPGARSARMEYLAAAGTAVMIAADLLVALAGRRTEAPVPFARFWNHPCREIHLTYEPVGPDHPELRRAYRSNFPVAWVYLISCLRGGHDVPQGARVADLVVETEGTGSAVFPVRAGLETSAVDWNRPGPPAAHACAPVCHDWWTRDASRTHYAGQAYGMVARLPAQAKVVGIRIRNRADHGSLVPLIVLYRGPSTPVWPPTEAEGR